MEHILNTGKAEDLMQMLAWNDAMSQSDMANNVHWYGHVSSKVLSRIQKTMEFNRQ